MEDKDGALTNPFEVPPRLQMLYANANKATKKCHSACCGRSAESHHTCCRGNHSLPAVASWDLGVNWIVASGYTEFCLESLVWTGLQVHFNDSYNRDWSICRQRDCCHGVVVRGKPRCVSLHVNNYSKNRSTGFTVNRL